MKLKYYLRGLGIGIAVTAAVLMLAGGNKESLTDEEIIARAKELGMVESVTLSQLSSENQETSQDVSDEVTSEGDSQGTSEAVSEEEAEVSSEENNSEESGGQEAGSEEASETEPSEEVSEEVSEEPSQNSTSEVIDEYVIIEVGAGDGSDTVSVKLEAAGMVEDAQMYDDFLCANGYDKILQTGVHEIPRTADWDMIAEILAGRM